MSDYISYTKKIFDLKNNINGIDRSGLHLLENEVNKNVSLVNKKWLLEKIKETATIKSGETNKR